MATTYDAVGAGALTASGTNTINATCTHTTGAGAVLYLAYAVGQAGGGAGVRTGHTRTVTCDGEAMTLIGGYHENNSSTLNFVEVYESKVLASGSHNLSVTVAKSSVNYTNLKIGSVSYTSAARNATLIGPTGGTANNTLMAHTLTGVTTSYLLRVCSTQLSTLSGLSNNSRYLDAGEAPTLGMHDVTNSTSTGFAATRAQGDDWLSIGLQVRQQESQLVQPGGASATLTGSAPIVTNLPPAIIVEPTGASLTLTGSVPTVTESSMYPMFGSIGTPLGQSSRAGGCSFDIPDGVVANEIVVVVLYAESFTTITPPEGFVNAPDSPINATNHKVHIWWKRATGDEDTGGTYDFTWTGTIGVGGAAMRFSKCVTTGNPWDVTNSATGSGSTTPAVSDTTTEPNCLWVWEASNYQSGGCSTITDGIERLDLNSGCTLAVDTKFQASQGGSGSITATTFGTDASTAWLGALKPAAVTVIPTAPTLSVTGGTPDVIVAAPPNPAFGSIGTRLDGGTDTAAAVPVPSGVQAGSFVGIWLLTQASNQVPTLDATPPGFELASECPVNEDLSWWRGWLYVKIATGNDSGTYDFTVNYHGGIAPWRTGVAFRYENVDQTTPIEAVDRGKMLSTATYPDLSLTTLGNDRTLLWLGLGYDGDNTYVCNPPNGFNVRHNTNPDASVTVTDKVQASQGSTGTISATQSGGGATGVCWLGALKPPDANITVTPTAATLSVTLSAPDVIALNPITVTPTGASATLTGSVPIVSTPVLVTPSAATLSTTGSVPLIHNVIVPTGATISLTGSTPTVTAPVLVTPTAATITLTGSEPTITTPVLVTPVAASLTLTGSVATLDSTIVPTGASLSTTLSAPTVAIEILVVPTAATLSITLAEPVVETPVLVTPSAATLSTTLSAPIVEAIGTALVIPSAGTLTLTGSTPEVTTSASITAEPQAATLTITTAAPEIVLPVEVTPVAASITLTGSVPNVVIDVHVVPDMATLTTTLFEPVVTAPAYVAPEDATLTLTASDPIVTATENILVVPDAAILTLTGSETTVFTPVLVTPDAPTITLTGSVPDVLVTDNKIVEPDAPTITLTGSVPQIQIVPLPIATVAHASAAISASRSPSVTFSGYTPALNDVVVLFPSSTSTGVTPTAPGGWVNPLGGTVDVESDAHEICCVYHLVTQSEVDNVTTTYTATNLYGGNTTGNVAGCVVRGADPTSVIDSVNTTFSSTNSASPHVLASLTGTNLSDGSLIVSAVAGDGVNTYDLDPDGWSRVEYFNTNQAKCIWTRDARTVSGQDVPATNVTPTSGDEYASVTIAFTVVGSQLVIPSAATLTLTGAAPEVVVPQLVTPDAGTLSLTGSTPYILIDTLIVPEGAILTLTSSAPEVTAPVLITPEPASLTLTASAPTITAPALVLPSAGTLTLTGSAPEVTAGGSQLLVPNAASLSITAYAPEITAGGSQTIVPNSGSLVITCFIPEIQVTDNKIIAPTSVGLTLTGGVPIVTAPLTIEPIGASLVVSGSAPTVLTPVLVTPLSGLLTLTGFVPQLHRVLNPLPALLVTTGFAPDVFNLPPSYFIPDAGFLTLLGSAPSILIVAVPTPERRTIHVPRDTRTVRVPKDLRNIRVPIDSRDVVVRDE